MSKPKIWIYLHHVELGQRYPVSEDIIIGRQSGQIVFLKDDRLNPQHCQIFQGERGLSIRDLGTANGTVMDGRLLSPQKAYPLRDGAVISIGAQVFKCVEPSARTYKPPKRKKKKSTHHGPDLTPFFAIIFAAAAGAFLWSQQTTIFPLAKSIIARLNPPAPPPPPPPLTSPFELVYKDVQGAYDLYRDMGQNVRDGQLAGKAMAVELRNTLIPRFTAAKAKLDVLKPATELERRKIAANTKLVATITRQLKAMASFAETKDAKYSKEIEKVTAEVEAASEEARRVNEIRTPAAQN